jgi:hypothetical protein
MSSAMLAKMNKATPAGDTRKTAKSSSTALTVGDPNSIYEREANQVADGAMSTGTRRFDWSLSKMSVRPTAFSSIAVNQPGDAYEHEADRAADEVMGGGATKLGSSLSRVSLGTPLQRKCACGGECEECKKDKILQREAHAGTPAAAAPPIVHDVLSGPGRQLDHGVRSFMESRFGYDFGAVRIFHDDAAANSARAVSANAYTVGEKIVFNRGRYAPESTTGRRLLAHELAHVVQQDGGSRGLLQRDTGEVELVEEEPKEIDTVLMRAFRAADAKQWEVAARLANGLSPYEMKFFLGQYKDPELRSYLHIGAVNAAGVGDKSAIALATEGAYKAVKQKEAARYARELAKQNGTAPPVEDGTPADSAPPPRPLSVQEKKKRCESGETKGLMVFPLRLPRGLWRISVAPISAERSGNDIVVHQPVNGVLGDPMFHREVKTLPLNTFLGGVHLAPDDIVRVRLYDDNERVICASGEQMLNLSKASDTAVLLSILGTVLDAASVMAPGVTQGLSRGATLALGAGTIAANEGLEVARQESAVHYGLQDHIQWGQIAFETLLQAVTLGFGGRLTDAAVKKVAGVAGGTYSRAALKFAVETAVQGSIAVLQSTARELFARLSGEKRDMTVAGFLEELAGEFAQGALFHAIMTAAAHAEPGVHGAPEGGGGPKPGGEHVTPAPTHGEPAARSHPHEGPQAHAAPLKMEPETAKSPSSFRKEEALATKAVHDPGAAEPHEVIATKKGIGRCSDSPCPAIPLIYKQDLATHPEFAERYRKIREIGTTDVNRATAEAAILVRDIEITRRNAAKMPRMGGEAPTNPDRGASKEQWKEMERKRRWGSAVDQSIDSMDSQATTSKVKGGQIEGHTVPTKVKSRLDVDALPGGGDSPIPLKQGETGRSAGRQAVTRIRTLIGHTIAEIPELAKLWEQARTSTLGGKELTKENYREMYRRARQNLWKLVGGKGPDAEAAREVLRAAGFGIEHGGRNAPTLEGADSSLRAAESRLSLDHKDEKAIGDNWKKALDAENIQLEFEMANKERENYQQRHPELRPAASQPTPQRASQPTPQR